MDVLDKFKINHRTNLRGLRKCTSCGKYNGMRAKCCMNKLCELSKQTDPKARKDRRRPPVPPMADLIQLVSKTDTKLYSIRIRDKNTELRNFVQITDKTISSDEDGCIISRNAICYVDTCKYDSHDVNISCKHVKHALDNNDNRMATALRIDFSIWHSMCLSAETKARLWNAYEEAELTIPLVQRINRTMFVVKCETTSAFPAGRLHVCLNVEDGLSYSCACKKIKILMSPNNSITLENDKCEHLYLTLAALLSNEQLKVEFRQHISRFSGDNMFNLSDDNLDDNLLVTEDFIKFSEDILNDCGELSHSNDMDINLNETMNEISITNNSTAICLQQSNDQIESIKLIQVPPINDIAEDDLQSLDLDSIKIINDHQMSTELESLELIDCQIELMDQFKLTDHIDLCNNEINEQDIFGDQIICDIMSLSGPNSPAAEPNATSILDTIIPIANETNVAVATLGQIENKKRKKPMKDKNKIKKRKSLDITNDDDDDDDDDCQLEEDETFICSDLAFSGWLNSIIEQINALMDYNETGQPEKLRFSVYHGFFNNLRSRFSVGVKRRLPTKCETIPDGKYKGLRQFTWHFSNANLLKHIFSTENMSIEIFRTFRRKSNGTFKYVECAGSEVEESISRNSADDSNFRKIKATSYQTYLRVKSNNYSVMSKTNCKPLDDLFIIEWIPNVLPKSKHGAMQIQFQFGHKKNNKMLRPKDRLS